MLQHRGAESHFFQLRQALHKSRDEGQCTDSHVAQSMTDWLAGTTVHKVTNSPRRTTEAKPIPVARKATPAETEPAVDVVGQSPASSFSKTHGFGRRSLSGDHSAKLVDMPHLIETVQQMGLPEATLTKVLDAVSSSVVEEEEEDVEEDAHMTSEGHTHVCHCSGGCSEAVSPSFSRQSALIADPEVASWLSSAFGIC